MQYVISRDIPGDLGKVIQRLADVYCEEVGRNAEVHAV